MALMRIGFAALVLPGCTLTMSEDMIFRPPSVTPAASVEDMTFKDGEGLFEVTEETPTNLAPLLPASVEHGFLETSTDPIAWSLIEGSVEDRSTRPLIVSCYGSGGDRPTHGGYYARKLLPYGDVFQFDYPGYGDSPGTPSIAGIEAARPTITAFAEEIAGDRPLIFWGHSLGGWVCPHFVKDSAEADAIVYETTALNSEEASKEWKPWFMRVLPIKMVPEEGMNDDNNALPIKGFEGPVLVIGGAKDKVLPAWLSRSLYEAIQAQGNDVTYIEAEQGTHINAPMQMDFQEQAVSFFAAIKNLQSGSDIAQVATP